MSNVHFRRDISIELQRISQSFISRKMNNDSNIHRQYDVKYGVDGE